jgi:uncharacterized protein (TIGR02996 family)
MPRRAHPSTVQSAEDPLFARVLADPDDNALRQVWADALQESGDPRGELIAIQIAASGGSLTPAQDKRVRSLIAKHALDWLGPLSDIVMRKAGLVFDRGVISSCQIQVKNLTALNAAIGHPLWAAVRKVWFCDHHAWDPRIVPLLADPAFRSLREVTCIGTNNVFAPLATGDRPLPFTSIWTLEDRWRSSTPNAMDEVGTAPALPALRHFGCNTSNESTTASLFRMPLIRRIESLGLSVLLPVGECLLRAEPLANLRTLEVRPQWIINQGAYRSHAVLTFTRDEDGRFSDLSVRLGSHVGPLAPRLEGIVPSSDEVRKGVERISRNLRGVVDHLDTIPATLPRRIVVRLPKDARLEKALRRFRSADIELAPHQAH